MEHVWQQRLNGVLWDVFNCQDTHLVGGVVNVSWGLEHQGMKLGWTIVER